tara:strand:- start:23329 stop:23862 length:534 start_codon:yes stop_codon:yes gene_type:complete
VNIILRENKMNLYTMRDVTDDDHHWLVELHNDPLVLKNLTNPTPITLNDHMKWWGTIDGKTEIRKIFCVNGEKVGFCKFYKIDHNNLNCVLGADIHITHRGKGYSKPMWRLMLNFCYDTLKLKRTGLTTVEYNHIGQRVYKYLGFKVEGKLLKSLLREGKWYDQICMYHLSDWEITP